MFCTDRRAQRKKILLGFYCTSYIMPCLVASAKGTTDAIVSGTETIDTGIHWVALRGKFQCYLVERRKFPWEALKATSLISPNFWTSYSCICSFISHQSKKSVKEKLLFSTLMYWHTLRWKWGVKQRAELRTLCLSIGIYNANDFCFKITLGVHSLNQDPVGLGRAQMPGQTTPSWKVHFLF